MSIFKFTKAPSPVVVDVLSTQSQVRLDRLVIVLACWEDLDAVLELFFLFDFLDFVLILELDLLFRREEEEEEVAPPKLKPPDDDVTTASPNEPKESTGTGTVRRLAVVDCLTRRLVFVFVFVFVFS
jgi:hypothetical protein